MIHALYYSICDDGDKVIYAAPSWNNNHYTHFVGGEHVVIEASAENNFMPTVEQIKPFIKERYLDFTLFTSKSNRHYFHKSMIWKRSVIWCWKKMQLASEQRKKIIRSVRSNVLASYVW